MPRYSVSVQARLHLPAAHTTRHATPHLASPHACHWTTAHKLEELIAQDHRHCRTSELSLFRSLCVSRFCLCRLPSRAHAARIGYHRVLREDKVGVTSFRSPMSYIVPDCTPLSLSIPCLSHSRACPFWHFGLIFLAFLGKTKQEPNPPGKLFSVCVQYPTSASAALDARVRYGKVGRGGDASAGSSAACAHSGHGKRAVLVTVWLVACLACPTTASTPVLSSCFA